MKLVFLRYTQRDLYRANERATGEPSHGSCETPDRIAGTRDRRPAGALVEGRALIQEPLPCQAVQRLRF